MTFNARELAEMIAPFMGPDFSFKIELVLNESYLSGRREQAEIDAEIADNYDLGGRGGTSTVESRITDKTARDITTDIREAAKKIGGDK